MERPARTTKAMESDVDYAEYDDDGQTKAPDFDGKLQRAKQDVESEITQLSSVVKRATGELRATDSKADDDSLSSQLKTMSIQMQTMMSMMRMQNERLEEQETKLQHALHQDPGQREQDPVQREQDPEQREQDPEHQDKEQHQYKEQQGNKEENKEENKEQNKEQQENKEENKEHTSTNKEKTKSTNKEQTPEENIKEADGLAANILSTKTGSARSQALAIMPVSQCPSTYKRYKQKFTAVTSVIKDIKENDTEFIKEVKAATAMTGGRCTDSLAALLSTMTNDRNLDDEFSKALFWGLISDAEVSEKATLAEMALHDCLAAQPSEMASIIKRCAKGEVGIQGDPANETFDYAESEGMDHLRTSGFSHVLAATLAVFGSENSASTDISNMKSEWTKMKQGERTVNEFVSDIEKSYREIQRVCKLLDKSDRAPRLPDLMDVLEKGARPTLMDTAMHILTVVKGISRDDFEYSEMKSALITAQRAKGAEQDRLLHTAVQIQVAAIAPQKHKPYMPREDRESLSDDTMRELTMELQKAGLCIHNTKGKCTRGDECKYSHESLESKGLDSKRFENYYGRTRFLYAKADDEETRTPKAAPALMCSEECPGLPKEVPETVTEEEPPESMRIPRGMVIMRKLATSPRMTPVLKVCTEMKAGSKHDVHACTKL